MPTRTVTARTRRAVPLLALAVTAALAGCAGDEGPTGENGNEVQVDVTTAESADGSTAAFCDAARRALAADDEGDALAAADQLQPFVEQLPDEAAQDLRAYVDGLQAANPNPGPGDAEGRERAETRFRAFAEERCGD